jgi:hypothetical protein
MYDRDLPSYYSIPKGTAMKIMENNDAYNPAESLFLPFAQASSARPINPSESRRTELHDSWLFNVKLKAPFCK